MDIDAIKDGFGDKTILEVVPKSHESNYILNNSIRKLKQKNTGKVIPHFFRCTACESVLKINTTTHHANLKRHLRKCFGIDLSKEGCLNPFTNMNIHYSQITFHITIGKIIKIAQNNFRDLISAAMKIAHQFGPIDISSLELPNNCTKSEW